MDDRDSWLKANGQPESPLRAIRAKCLDCCCYQPSLVRECEITKCVLHPFRMGKNPFRTKREMTEEQLIGMRERMAKMHLARTANSHENKPDDISEDD